MLRRHTGLLLLTLALTACTAKTGTLPPPKPGAPVIAPPPRLALARANPEGKQSPMALEAIDPVTLAPDPDLTPFPLGHHFTHAVSPDGRTLAAFLWPSGTHNKDGALHLFNLATWQTKPLGVTVDDHVSALLFSPDSQTLYWLQPTERHPDHGMPKQYALFTHPRSEHTLKLPDSFLPIATYLLAGGDQIAVFGQPTTSENQAQGDARVLRINLKAGTIDADIPLPGQIAGYTKNADGQLEHAYPGIAWDGARDLLYVVHADADRITVVDLAAGKIQRTAELRAPSWLERLGLESVAHAKMNPGVRRQAALSPDGTRLYVTTHRDTVAERIWRGTPEGLIAIDTASLKLIKRLDLPVSDLALSPDGSHLLLWGGAYGCDPSCYRKGHGIYLIETKKLTQRAHLLPNHDAHILGFAPDGRHAYIQEDTGTLPHVHRALDLVTGALGARREMPQGYGLYLTNRR